METEKPLLIRRQEVVFLSEAPPNRQTFNVRHFA
jgi:hypothetical protein